MLLPAAFSSGTGTRKGCFNFHYGHVPREIYVDSRTVLSFYGMQPRRHIFLLFMIIVFSLYTCCSVAIDTDFEDAQRTAVLLIVEQGTMKNQTKKAGGTTYDFFSASQASQPQSLLKYQLLHVVTSALFDLATPKAQEDRGAATYRGRGWIVLLRRPHLVPSPH